MYLLEIDAYDPATSSIRTLRYGTGALVTGPSDTPANTYYEPRLSQPGSYARNVFSSGTTGGEPTVSTGVIELANPDGGLDFLINLAFDGRALRLYYISDDPASFYSTFANRTLNLAGIVDFAEISWTKVTLNIRDRLKILDKPIQTTLYAGTSISAGLNNAEGRPDDVKGQPKPLAYGRVLNVPLVAANAYDLIYQGADNSISSVEAVYDRGVALTRVGTNFADIASLRAQTLTAGQYAVCLSPFHARLGGTPAGQITADFTEGSTAALRTVAQCVQRILQRAGLVLDTDFTAFDIAILDQKTSAECGIWIGTDTTTYLDALGRLLQSVGAYCVPAKSGVLKIGRFEAPVASGSTVPLLTYDILDQGQALERIRTNDETGGIPVWSVKMNYARNNYLQDATSLAGSVTDQRRAFLAKELRTAVAQNAATKTVYLSAQEITVDTLLLTEAAALTEANRRLTLFGVRRDFVNARIVSQRGVFIDLGMTMSLTVPRFGYDAGKTFVIIGLDENFETGITTVSLWG